MVKSLDVVKIGFYNILPKSRSAKQIRNSLSLDLAILFH